MEETIVVRIVCFISIVCVCAHMCVGLKEKINKAVVLDEVKGYKKLDTSFSSSWSPPKKTVVLMKRVVHETMFCISNEFLHLGLHLHLY